MNHADFSVIPCALQKLQQDIADDYARFEIETKARYVSMPDRPVNQPLYDVSKLEPQDGGMNDEENLESDRRDLARAVRYLDMRGQLLRPIAGYPNIVAIGGGK